MHDPLQPEMLREIWEDSKQEASKAENKFDTTQHKVLDERIAFFEKLALFDTGTIAATITLVATLRQHQSLYYQVVLFCGWVILLIAMACCLWRNWLTHDHLYYMTQASSNDALGKRLEAEIDFFMAAPDPTLNEAGQLEDKAISLQGRKERAIQHRSAAKQLEMKSDKKFTLLRAIQLAALILTTIGITCIVFFAIENLRNNSRPEPSTNNSTCTTQARILPSGHAPSHSP